MPITDPKYYQEAYEKLFEQLSEPVQKRVLAVRGDGSIVDKDVEIFVREVIAVAESNMDKPKPDLK